MLSNLFAAIYLDEDVPIVVAELFRAHGFKAVTAREAGQLGREDREQLAYATSHSMVLLSHNRVDYEILAQEYYEAGMHHKGMILAVQHSPYELARKVLRILDNFTADEIEDIVLYV
jgi:predicted nuclease of predicted toxin-antitoxin system